MSKRFFVEDGAANCRSASGAGQHSAREIHHPPGHQAGTCLFLLFPSFLLPLAPPHARFSHPRAPCLTCGQQQNFVIGLGSKCNDVYCVDFGLAKLYRDRKTLVHLPLRDGSLAGTPRYASISNHLGIAQSRRDDLESIAYMLIYFLKGKLPWQGLKASDKRTKYGLILECKQSTSINTLCEGLPREFSEFLQYSRTMRFDEEPNLDYTRKLFRDLYSARGYDTLQGKMWDWDPTISSSAAIAAKTAAKNTDRPSTMPAAPDAAAAGNDATALERTQSAGAPTRGSAAAKKRATRNDDESLEPKLGEEGAVEGTLPTRPNTAGDAMVVDNP